MEKGFILLLSFLAVHFVGGQEVPTDGIYVIKSAMDGGVIRPLGNGQICERLGSVVPIYRLDPPYDTSFHWNFRYRDFSGYFTVESNFPGEGNVINELTYADVPPFCFLEWRMVEFVISGGDETFTIRDSRTNQCLTTLGSEIGMIFWRPCGDVGQTWNLIPV